MSEAVDLEAAFSPATSGNIAVINLQSARQHAWNRFLNAPQRPGIAEAIVEQEGVVLEFLSDFEALDRLSLLAGQLVHLEDASPRSALIQAQVASMTHRFVDARCHLAQAQQLGAPAALVRRLSLGIDQACGAQLDAVLAARRQIAAQTRKLEDLVPLGALLADMGEFDEAYRAYCIALREYHDVSPFAMAWVCFQLGLLWGELAPERQPGRASRWYLKAIAYLPGYVKARVHLAEIYLSWGQPVDAEAMLIPVVSSGDPEVHWRLGDVMHATGRSKEANEQLQAAQAGFETLLDKHLLAFADHGAEFYAGSGANPGRAFALARINLQNRPTLHAFEQAHATAVDANEPREAWESLVAAKRQWGDTIAFRQSLLSRPYRMERAHES